jgi:hypothetical protein
MVKVNVRSWSGIVWHSNPRDQEFATAKAKLLA